MDWMRYELLLGSEVLLRLHLREREDGGFVWHHRLADGCGEVALQDLAAAYIAEVWPSAVPGEPEAALEDALRGMRVAASGRGADLRWRRVTE